MLRQHGRGVAATRKAVLHPLHPLSVKLHLLQTELQPWICNCNHSQRGSCGDYDGSCDRQVTKLQPQPNGADDRDRQRRLNGCYNRSPRELNPRPGGAVKSAMCWDGGIGGVTREPCAPHPRLAFAARSSGGQVERRLDELGGGCFSTSPATMVMQARRCSSPHVARIRRFVPHERPNRMESWRMRVGSFSGFFQTKW